MLETLRKYWGYDSFRPRQEDIISKALAGEDVLALMPTGGGKSICFQVPAMMKEGICIVVSPLIALMKDQVQNLKARGIPALLVCAGMSYREIDVTLDNAVYGDYKFLYVSPERLRTDLFLARTAKMNVNYLVVDEAHCISQWGYDFRPEYLKIAEVRDKIGGSAFGDRPPVIALTATATRDVAEDIMARLDFRKPNLIVTGFERPNLSYSVRECENKLGQLLKVCNGVQGSGIVYVSRRKTAEEVTAFLASQGVEAAAYHAGMNSKVRAGVQDLWKKGDTRVIVSTNAVYSFTVTESAAFVANFTQSQGNIIQVTNLSQGWNWWSTYIEQEGIDGLEMLEGSLGANGHQIKSQTDYVNNYGTMWMGMLTSINNEETYMLNNNADCQIEMTGTPVSPADHPITVSSGWNWIGYPCTNTMSVSEAFVDFEPAYGDMVKSQSDYSMCFNGIWIGQLLDITPGTGLMYKSNRTETATLVYPEGGRNMEATVSIPRASHWTNDIHSYPDNMTVMAVVELDDVELTSDNYELAVFADGECRGSVRLMYVEQLNRYVAFLTITGEESTTLNFGLYNIQTGKEIINAEEQINYVTNAMVGSIDEPYTIHFRGTTGMDEWADNPVIGDKLYVRSPNKEGFVVISDMLGRVVFNQQIGESCVIDLKWLAPNTVYVIKVNNQSIKFIRR